MRIAICEAELNVAELLRKDIIKNSSFIQNKDISVKIFGNSFGILDYIENHNVDAVFIDVNLGKENGIELASIIQSRFKNVKIIFISGLTSCVEDVFDVVPFSILMKPIKEEKIIKVLTRLFDLAGRDKLNYIVFSNKEGIHTVDEKDIVYIESDGRYINVIMESMDRIRVIMTMNAICEKLTGNFIKVHRSYIINLSKIKKLEKNAVIMQNGVRVPISRGNYQMVYERYVGKKE